jgi:hypothetical protein
MLASIGLLQSLTAAAVVADLFVVAHIQSSKAKG